MTQSLDILRRLWESGADVDPATGLPGAAPERPSRPFAQSTWVFRCVTEILNAARSIQLMLSTEDDKIIESGPAYDVLFNRPDYSFQQFLTETVGFLALYREAYWIFADHDLLSPRSILVAGPDDCKPDIRRGELMGYQLRVGEGRRIPLFIEDVHPLIDFNPHDKFHGAGPLSAAKLAVSSNYQAALFNESAMANGGAIGTLITIPGKIDEDERRLFVSQFEARHRGARNAGRTCLMTGGADVKTLAQSMAELQMRELREYDSKEICAAFGVPPELVGLATEAQYSHGPAQQRFIVNTVTPLLAFVAGHITTGILPKFDNRKHVSSEFTRHVTHGLSRMPLVTRASWRRAKASAAGSKVYAWFAVEEHPTIRELTEDRAKNVLEFTKAGVSLNQLIRAHELPYEEEPTGDEVWGTLSDIPRKWILDAGPEGLAEPALPEGDEGAEPQPKATEQSDIVNCKSDIEKDESSRRRVWRAWTSSWVGIERQFHAALRLYYVRLQRELLAKLEAAYSEFAKSAASKDASDIVARVVFDISKERGRIRVINTTFWAKASELGARQTISEIQGLKGDKLAEAAKRATLSRMARGKLDHSSKRIGDTLITTQEAISRHLREGLEAGESLEQLTRRITEDLAGNRAKAQRIARTQTAGAVETGRFEGMKGAGIELKGWLSARDNEVRDEHRNAESEYAAGIPIDQPFVLHTPKSDVKLMYPGDPACSMAAMIINCRCLIIAVKAAGKELGIEFYQQLSFYSYRDMEAV